MYAFAVLRMSLILRSMVSVPQRCILSTVCCTQDRPNYTLVTLLPCLRTSTVDQQPSSFFIFRSTVCLLQFNRSRQYPSYKRKGKGSRNSSLKRSDMDHTVFRLQTHHTCLYLLSVHQTAPPLTSDSSHLIAAYYSFIDPVRMKG